MVECQLFFAELFCNLIPDVILAQIDILASEFNRFTTKAGFVKGLLQFVIDELSIYLISRDKYY